MGSSDSILIFKVFFGVSAFLFQYKMNLLTYLLLPVFSLVSHLAMPYSPSRLSSSSKSTRAVKKVAKSVGKAVKRGAATISRPFKKRRRLSSESIGK